MLDRCTCPIAQPASARLPNSNVTECFPYTGLQPGLSRGVDMADDGEAAATHLAGETSSDRHLGTIARKKKDCMVSSHNPSSLFLSLPL